MRSLYFAGDVLGIGRLGELLTRELDAIGHQRKAVEVISRRRAVDPDEDWKRPGCERFGVVAREPVEGLTVHAEQLRKLAAE